MTRPKPPCHNCEKRVSGCHSTCSDYLYFKVELEAFNKKVKEEKDIDYIFFRRERSHPWFK